MRVILATTLVLALGACDVPRAEPAVSVEEARITLPAVRGRPGAGYFTVKADAQSLRITGVTSPRVQRIELHDMSMAGGVMRMGPLRDASVPAGGELEFAPGGKHAMLFGVDPALKAGDTVPLTVSFDRAPAVTVQAEVQGPGGGHAGH
jgi:periplasmic copper chaperone A